MTNPTGSYSERLPADELAQALQHAHEGWALDLSPVCAAVMAERLLELFDFHRRDGAPAVAAPAEEEAAELRGELHSLDETLTKLRGAHLNLQNDYHRALKDTYAVQRVRAVHRRVLHRRTWICAECSGYGGSICDNGPHSWPCATVEALADPRPDTGRVRGATPPPAPATEGVLENALAVAGETSTGCFIPPRTPAGQRTRTRADTMDSRAPGGVDTSPTSADTVRAAIGRAFEIPTDHTPDTPGQDTGRTPAEAAPADTGQQDEHGM